MDIKYKAQSWCIQNGFKIYIKPFKNNYRVKVVVELNGVRQISPNFYNTQTEASDKIWELYVYLYHKHKNN